MGFCGKRLHDRSKKLVLRPVFFLLVVALRGACRLSLFFSRGHECGKADDYKGFCAKESKLPGRAGMTDEKKPELMVRA
jgi:hypothetical protein